MILAKVSNLLSRSCLPAPLSNQAASGQGRFCREALQRADVPLEHTEVAAAAGVAGKSDCKSVFVHQTLTHMHNLKQQCHSGVRENLIVPIFFRPRVAFTWKINACKLCRCKAGQDTMGPNTSCTTVLSSLQLCQSNYMEMLPW